MSSSGHYRKLTKIISENELRKSGIILSRSIIDPIMETQKFCKTLGFVIRLNARQNFECIYSE